MRRLIAILITVLVFSMQIICAQAVVYVGNTQITGSTTPSGATGTISVSGTTLTLENFSYTGEGYFVTDSVSNTITAGIYATDINHIILKNTNTVAVKKGASATDFLVGLYVLTSGNITISGGGSGSFSTQDSGCTYEDGIMMLPVSGTVELQSGCSIKGVASDATQESYGIQVTGNLIVRNGANIEGKAGTTSNACSGIVLSNTAVLTLEDGCHLLAVSPGGSALTSYFTTPRASLVGSVNTDGSGKVQYVDGNSAQYKYVETGSIPSAVQISDPVAEPEIDSAKTGDTGIVMETTALFLMGTLLCIVIHRKRNQTI